MREKIGKRLIDELKPEAKPYEVWDTEIPGLVLRVRPTGLMTYFLSYRRPDGRKTKIHIGSSAVLSPVQARDQARILLGKVTQGSDPSLERKKLKSSTLRAFLDQHYQQFVSTHRKSSAFTLGRIERCFPTLMNLPLDGITIRVIESWRSERINASVKPSTLNRDITALKAALNKAVEWDLIRLNPIAKLEFLKEDKSPNIRYLGAEELCRLRSALDAREQRYRTERNNRNEWCKQRGYDPLPPLDAVSFVDHLKPLVLLAINTGLRRGELLKLQWEQVIFSENPLITVTAKTTKNSTTRHVPLNKEALNILKLWNEQHRNPASGWVFPSQSKQGHLTELKTAWRNLLSEAKIENFRWHDSRHHFASALVIRGANLNTVRELLGHGDLKTTLRYAHLSPEAKAKAVALLDL